MARKVFLAHCHIAHDCVVGNNVVASNGTGLAGHVIVEDRIVFGANSGVHLSCRIGAYAMVGAYAKVVQDVAPSSSPTASRRLSVRSTGSAPSARVSRPSSSTG